ncbi:MAG: hypothetical protein A3C90_00210 [Candidatus Magasanikbacteria bacterium RIFCSPHIGHO2_02_FULL_51_14]|uniref:NAD-dependent epimerase/dehydratase domain-containing protein n=1 Tax=Candidatus Magasanikbacteria bacterium RIFCSPHIGHO2_02_FULL_51_14 TaxID=1798683 RepID=A0A1F6MDA9_9BACT|nr:MAG: hypothetical protein A3C90_00210 [Candidatus Magasanikbacteria bacterium RIFCSPHIGHO2_02_FULL_51_14]
MEILLLGGTGFIGEYLAKDLLQNDADHIVAAHISDMGDEERIAGVEYRRIDMEHIEDSFRSALRDIDVVVFAIQPDPAFIKKALAVLGGYPQKKKLVYLSTVLVYPEGSHGHREDAARSPLSAYEAGKALEEDMCMYFANESGSAVCIARLGNVYGDVKNRGIVDHLLRALVQKKTFHVNGDGTQTRDYIHVEDAARALNHLIHADQKNAVEIYNVCSGIGFSILDLIGMIEMAARKKLEYIFAPPIEEKHTVIGDPAKLRQTATSSEEGDMLSSLKKTYHAYLAHYE